MNSSRYFRLPNLFSSNSTTMFFQRLFAMANYSFSSSSPSSKTSIQAVYDICKNNFVPSTSPPPQLIHELSSILGTLPQIQFLRTFYTFTVIDFSAVCDCMADVNLKFELFYEKLSVFFLVGDYFST